MESYGLCFAYLLPKWNSTLLGQYLTGIQCGWLEAYVGIH